MFAALDLATGRMFYRFRDPCHAEQEAAIARYLLAHHRCHFAY